MTTRQARKQRRQKHHSPLHRRGRHVSAHLSPKYLEDPKVNYPRSLPLRQGDTVQIMRGTHKGEEGKVTRVDRRHFRVFVEGITVNKADGT
ncbi:MAG: 50S ribosomal protein L24, partial [Thermoplasmata archaeon]|nr:50S ribosomal protein L24 [Thermoplasmata archaeon]